MPSMLSLGRREVSIITSFCPLVQRHEYDSAIRDARQRTLTRNEKLIIYLRQTLRRSSCLPTIKKLMEVVPRESYIASIGMYGLEVEVVVGSSLSRCCKAKAHGCDDKNMSFFHACCCLLYCKYTHIILYILLNCRKDINFSHFIYPMCGEKSTFASII